MSKNLPAKYYQGNKKKTAKKPHERYQNLSKEKKKKVTIWPQTLQKYISR